MIIGFAGKPGAGKDSAAQILTDHGWDRRAFADPLKQVAARVFNTTVEEIEENKDHYRHVLQQLGTSMREFTHPDVWVDACIPRHEGYRTKLIVVSDVRFRNEVVRIHNLGGHVIRIRRKGRDSTDLVESMLDKHPFPTIDNDGSLQDLHDNVIATVSHLTRTPRSTHV